MSAAETLPQLSENQRPFRHDEPALDEEEVDLDSLLPEVEAAKSPRRILTLSDLVAANIGGQTCAKGALEDIARGTTGPDALEEALRGALRVWGPTGVTGFLRIIQKALERAA